MVNDSGQIYTIEGVAAAILMVVTAYLAVSSTTVLTQQDVHIINMQLQQLGNDALAMMDTPDSYSTNVSNLSFMVNGTLAGNPVEAANNITEFRNQFMGYLNATTNTGMENNLYSYNATIYYRNVSDQVNSLQFNESPFHYYHESAVMVSRWVYLPGFDNTTHLDMRSGNQSVLLEVLLWRI
jgi:hypothetical protein